MQKPRVFISHIMEEAELAELLKKHLLKDFLNMIDVFASSDDTSIPLGSRWLDDIDKALKEAQIELLLCSYQSIRRPWINFEAGAGWIRGIPVVPICHTSLQPSDLPAPLNMLQSIEAHEIPGIQKLYILVANNLGASTPAIDFKVVTDEIKDFEERYGELITKAARPETDRQQEDGVADVQAESEKEVGSEEQEIGLVEGQKAAQQFLAITSKIVPEVNRTIQKVNEKLERFGKSSRRGQDHKIALQIAYELNNGASKIENLIESLQESINNAASLFRGYTIWLLDSHDPNSETVIRFRQQITELLESIEAGIKGVRSNRASVFNLRIISGEVSRASSRMAQALDGVISLLEDIEKSCIGCMELINAASENNQNKDDNLDSRGEE